MSEDNVLKIGSLAPGRNVYEVRGALGLISFYGGFVPHYSDICAPLNALTKKVLEWDWSPECQSAWETWLAAIQEKVFLAGFDP